MKELDFDELDKAVNSLMTNVPKTAASTPDEPKEKTLEIASTLPGDEKPSLDKLGDATAKVIAPAPVSSVSTPVSRPAPATRRGGRFMDVVHPSADMKKSTVPPRTSVFRQGVTIAPSDSASAPRPLEVPSAPLVMPSAPAAPPRSVEVPERTAPKSDWPDPLEMANFEDETAPEPAVAEEPVVQPVESTLPSESAPLISPFLPDTKVDKRPLGGAPASSDDEPDHTPVLEKEAGELTTSDPKAQLPALPEDVAPELPEELQTDLIAIEADTSHQHALEAKDEPTHEKEKKPELIPKEEAPKKQPLQTPPEDEKLLMAGPTSIPQQYREEPSTGDQESGAIYDTDTYHQPLAHPAKKKSGWLWVLWIVIILVLGAGTGAALYFFGIV
jgi:hypothetical protein